MDVANWRIDQCPHCGKDIILAVNQKNVTIMVNPDPDITNGTIKLVEVGAKLPRARIPLVRDRFGMVMRTPHTAENNTCLSRGRQASSSRGHKWNPRG